MRRIPGAGSRAPQGFTLIELMVALALAAIISVVIASIASMARTAYTNTVTKVDVYSRFRFAFAAVQSDLRGWIPTQELEYYIDGRGGRPADFHWQPGEEVPDRDDELGGGVVDGGVKGEFDEYAYIEQRQYRSIEKTQGDAELKPHDAYSVYFRTMTYVDGAHREANVEYMLVDTSRPISEWRDGVPPPPVEIEPNHVHHLALYKVVRYYVISGDTIQKMMEYPIKRRVLELASNVTDFRVEYLTQNPFNQDAQAEFRTPEEDYTRFVELATRPLREGSPNEGYTYRKVFGYGSMRLELEYPRATGFSARWGDEQLRGQIGHQPVRFGFQTHPRDICFAELTTGDRMFVFTDNRAGQIRQQGGALAGGGAATNLQRFPAGDYTVKANLQGMLEFVEDVDASFWNDQDQRPLNYKAAFVPSALRITLRMVDDNGMNPKTMQQVVWLRRKAR